MTHVAAVVTVKVIREEIVSICGAGGPDIASINELLRDLEKGDWSPEAAVEEAMKIKSRVRPISH